MFLSWPTELISGLKRPSVQAWTVAKPLTAVISLLMIFNPYLWLDSLAFQITVNNAVNVCTVGVKSNGWEDKSAKEPSMVGMIVRHEIEHQAPLKIVKLTIFYHIIVLNSSSLVERSLQVMFTVGKRCISFP